MKYRQEKEILAQMQLLNDLVQSQDEKIQELQKQAAGVDEEEEKLKADCLEADLKAFHSRPKWERVQVYKNDDEYTQEWLEHWEEDPRLLKYRENRDGKTTELKPQKEEIEEEYLDIHQDVRELLEKGHTYAQISKATGVSLSTIGVWKKRFGWKKKSVSEVRKLVNQNLKPYKMSGQRANWHNVMDTKRIKKFFIENKVYSENTRLDSLEVASQYAESVGLDDISQEINRYWKVNDLRGKTLNYYKELQVRLNILATEGVLVKYLLQTNAWTTYVDVLDEDGEPVIGDDGVVETELQGRCKSINTWYMNKEDIQ
tara:strand:+ start:430 stop:1374 length:945 start_codon:yes stop_codon:yes gene_type:complete